MVIKRETANTNESNGNNSINDFQALLHYINFLASHKMGYPVSLLTYLGLVDNTKLGIKRDSLANILLNNVGDPFKDSETSLMEVKKHEREIITILERYFGLPKNEARGYVTTGGTEGNFAGLWWSKRYLINELVPTLIKYDDAIKMNTQEEQEINVALTKIPLTDVTQRLSKLQKIIEIKNKIMTDRSIVQQLLTPTVLYSKGHTHYSIPKIAEILRLNIRGVEANSDGSINIPSFKKELLLLKGAHPYSPVIVIANIGTTITGAIDDVPAINKILAEMLPDMPHTIHLDGALTGFVLPILKPFGDVKNYFSDIGANTLAVSAHKYPGLSQPCGIILANRPFFEKAFEKSERNIDYVGNILDVTITGSRSGLNVLMFYNALVSLGLKQGNDHLYEMVQNNLTIARYLYDELVKIFGIANVQYPYHFNVMFPRPSLELAKKYQLMLTGDIATICVLTNVTRELVNQFIIDLRIDKEKAYMTDINQRNEFAIKTLSDEHVKSTTELFIKSFCESEPITKHLTISPSDYRSFASEVIQKAAKEGLSKVALDNQNKVIACCIAEDIADPFIPKPSHYPKLKPVFTFLEALSKPFLADKKFAKNKIAHVWIAAVDADYRGHKLSIEVDKACGENLARRGFDYVYAEFTNPLSEKIVNQYNIFKRFNLIKFNDYVNDRSQKPFAGLEGYAASYIIVIRPGINLNALENCYKVEEKY